MAPKTSWHAYGTNYFTVVLCMTQLAHDRARDPQRGICPAFIDTARRVYVTVGRPSVRLSYHSAAALRWRGFALWARRAGDIDRLLQGRC